MPAGRPIKYHTGEQRLEARRNQTREHVRQHRERKAARLREAWHQQKQAHLETVKTPSGRSNIHAQVLIPLATRASALPLQSSCLKTIDSASDEDTDRLVRPRPELCTRRTLHTVTSVHYIKRVGPPQGLSYISCPAISLVIYYTKHNDSSM